MHLPVALVRQIFLRHTASALQAMNPTLFLDVLHGLKTAASCVLLYNDTITITSSRGTTTENPISTTHCNTHDCGLGTILAI
jgi:hypothetical protein